MQSDCVIAPLRGAPSTELSTASVDKELAEVAGPFKDLESVRHCRYTPAPFNLQARHPMEW